MCLLWTLPRVSSLMALGIQATESDTERVTIFPHFPHLNKVAKELKCPLALLGVSSTRDTINLLNNRL